MVLGSTFGPNARSISSSSSALLALRDFSLFVHEESKKGGSEREGEREEGGREGGREGGKKNGKKGRGEGM